MKILIFSTLSGLSTVIGGLLAICFKSKQSKNYIALMLGLASGVMASVVLLDLLPEAIAYTNTIGVIAGFAIGILIMVTLEYLVPHLHKSPKVCDSNEYLKMGLFVALGIALHNLPEGLAIGAGYQAAPELGAVIALAIALHNIPEGLGLSVPLCVGGMKPLKVLFICLLAGIFTPIGTIIGMLLFTISESFIGISLATAAGAMTYIVVDELIPQAWQQTKLYTALGLVIGILVAYLAH
ncbi:ZIP family metal transporter [Clostridium sp. 'deep sea']|uniref:ZIP family metal transporter n=1 Tax=Clostridium sp. 'deep sea' TaxID=2779445 RepID=UPI0018967CAA|nr:ZIP family metal transporter [Clostridium sp. 'deep sea']QOR34274.1 ZIP family metal transporter [Clostridium sp. 'deep sea']